MDDAPLIERSLAGDSAAFGELVQRHQRRLFNAMWHMLGCVEEAEDVAQEAFVQAYVKLASFKQDSAFYTWLYRIAFNLAISGRRKKKAERSVEHVREMSGNEPADRGDSPAGTVLRQEEVSQVQAALGELPEEYRAILVLREIQGCSYESIGEILEIPIGTVRSRLHRARLHLRQQLQEMYPQLEDES